MTDANDYPMPFIMSSDKAAKKIINIISKKKRCAIFPWQMAIIGRLMHILPSFIWDLLAKNGPKKKRNLI
jgi:short-subunit dehydrogenase